MHAYCTRKVFFKSFFTVDQAPSLQHLGPTGIALNNSVGEPIEKQNEQ